MSSRTTRWLRRTSWALMGLAVLVVGYVGTLVGYQAIEQRRLSGDWAQAHPAGSIADVTTTTASDVITRHPHLAQGQPIARMTVPKIGFDAIVTEGSDGGILSSGPGHESHTDYPGEGGVILIGNHNGFSMSWNDLHPGDEIVLEMSYGRYHYRVTNRDIVSGDDSSIVHRAHSGETLFISTCWPLWAGAFAHQRLVFTAVPVGNAA